MFLSRISSAFLLLCISTVTNAAIIASDDFDGGDSNLVSFSLTPGNGTPFPSSSDDVFGIVDRTINARFRDNSASTTDTFGILDSTKTDNVFGVQDLRNGSNPGGTGTATWVFDINNAPNLSLSIDFAAIGDFESSGSSPDFLQFSVNIDGGLASTVINVIPDESASQTYTFEGGNTRNINDPAVANGIYLNNQFQTVSVDLLSLGTGSQLTLNLLASSNGPTDLFAFDNIAVSSAPVPLPAAFWLFFTALSAILSTVRRRAKV